MNVVKKIIIIALSLGLFNKSFAEDFAPPTQTAQVKFTEESTLTINSGVTLGSLTTQNRAHINAQSDSSVTVNSGGTILSLNNAVQGADATRLTVTNSGTIRAAGSKAINLKDNIGSTITNNSGGIIRSGAGDAISGEQDTGDETSGNTITNSGTIYSDDQRAINFFSDATTATVTNNSSGHIYNSNTNETIKLDTSSTLTNSGKIENKNSADNNSILLIGDNNTVTLKDSGLVIGTIGASSGTSGNKLKIQHGIGQSYYYKTSGDFDLEDLDGNQIVKGSAGSVGQGGSETLDELLSYKTINLRNFFDSYTNSNFYNNEGGWGEVYASNLNRDQNASSKGLEFELINIGANIIYPTENSNIVMAFEGGIQDFTKDYKINYQSLHGGIFTKENQNFFDLDTFLITGVTLKESERKILTNTTSSGTLITDGNFQTYAIHIGAKKNNPYIIPNVGFTSSFSVTPSYDESNYFSWRNRKVGNISFYLNDIYEIKKDELSKLSVNWDLNFRNLIGDEKQTYSINGTSATYDQANDLTREISLLAGLAYEKYVLDNGKVGFSINGKTTSQNTKGLSGNVSFKMNF